MTTAVAKRASYSYFDVPSLYSGTRLRVVSRALERLLIELETTPSVTDCRLDNQEVSFVLGQKERAALLHFSLSRQGDSRPHGHRVQLVTGTQSVEEQAALHAGRFYCEQRGLKHCVVAANRPAAGFFELQNRNAAHAWLTRAASWPSRILEGQLERELLPGPLCLSELARRLGVTDIQAKVVFIRCWLRGLVQWDIGNEFILRDLTARGVDHG